MSVTKSLYGKLPDGTEIDQYTLTNAGGLKVKIITYGATITDVEVPDRNGKLENVTLFRDSLDGYLDKNTPYFGATVGRYANRIAKGKFTLDGKEYTWPSTTSPTTCTAATRASTRWSGRPTVRDNDSSA